MVLSWRWHNRRCFNSPLCQCPKLVCVMIFLSWRRSIEIALFAHPSSPPRSCWRRSIEIATYGFKNQLSFLGGDTVVKSLFHLWITLFFFQRLADWSTSSFNLDLVAAALYCELVSSAPWSRTSYGVLIFDSAFKGFKHRRSSRCLWELHPLSHLTAFIFWLSACKLRQRSPLTAFILRLSV